MTDRPGYTADHVLRDLSLARRVGHVLAGLGGLATAVLVGALWATEPGPLPARTQVAFAAVIVVGLAWAGVAGWALGRRPLFAADRVVAAGLALCASTLVTLGTVAIALTQGSGTELVVAVLVGAALVGAAGVALTRARAHRRALLALRRDLEAARRPDPGPAPDEPPRR
ncbi:hypothetical protein [Micromonospora rosaria]|uniref:hypothetical protein n=1 Tax=Micromonospora rosaria TaxID=47874 RepID=UPI000835F527|nr:hypothetical protein [Micromonospora rosaria]